MNKAHMFKAAQEVSHEADYTGVSHVKVGCVLVYKGTVIAKGANSDKTHPQQEKYNKYRFKKAKNHYLPAKTHAEIAALSKIKELDIDFSDVQLFTYRALKDGHIAMARPCPACMAAIRNLGIRKIHYTTPDGYADEKLI